MGEKSHHMLTTAALQERGASEEVVVEGVSLGRPATCGKGRELIVSPSSPSSHHHLAVLLDTYRQVGLLKSLLLLSLTCVSWGRGGGCYNYKRGKRRHMILLSPD